MSGRHCSSDRVYPVLECGVGGARATDEDNGREFLRLASCSRCGSASTFTDSLDNGIVSTMADDNTVLNTKQVLANGVLSSVVIHLVS